MDIKMEEPTLVLRSTRTEDLRFTNKIEGGQAQIHFEHKYSYSVKYAKESGSAEGTVGRCRGEFHVRLCDRDLQENFMVEATVIGFFTYTGGFSKEELHRRSYKELFPHVRALVNAVTTLCGVPPIMIPVVDIEKQDIYAIDMNGRKADE